MDHQKEYKTMSAKEKIEYNLEGIKKELISRGIDSSCSCHKVHCIDCAISEITSNLKNLHE